jgi:hypothetical protein
MPFSAKDTARYREDVQAEGRSLEAKEREELLKVCSVKDFIQPAEFEQFSTDM